MAVLQTIAFVIYIIAGILMILAILLQEGKGGGLAGLGGAHAEATFGATNPLRRFTTIMAVIFLFLACFIVYTSRGREIGIRDEQPPAAQSSDEAASSDMPASEASAEAAPADGEHPAPATAPSESEPGGEADKPAAEE